jgi:uncharacterized protein YaiL (DUF2058 family)
VQSLRDKLLKAGLVTQEQAQKVDAPPVRPAPEPERDESPIPALPPLPGSKAHQRLEAQKQIDLNRKLREMAKCGQVAREEGARTFHFMTRKGKLRRIDLSEGQAKQLEEGALAVVESPEPAQIEHVLVSAETAEAMAKLSDKAVRFWNRPGAPQAD